MRLIFTRLKIYFKRKLALSSLVTLDSALAESKKSMLHAKRESLLSPLSWCVALDFKVAVVPPPKRSKRGKSEALPLIAEKAETFSGLRGAGRG